MERPAFRHVLSLTVLLFSASAAFAQWTAEGPGPIIDGQVEGILDGEVVGAVNTVAPHPVDATVLYVGGANGGIWKTTTATAASPSWTLQTDAQASLSIGALEFDPTDATHETLMAGFGRYSSFGGVGGSRAGFLRTTDGGGTWTAIDGGMAGRNISGLAPRGATIVASVDVADAFTCSNIGIWRSTDTGDTWSQITDGINRGTADALASDPSSSSTLYASLVFADDCDTGGVNGIFKSTNTGESWTKVSTAAMDALLTDSSGTHVEIAVGLSDNVFVAITPSTTGQLGGIFRSGNGGTTWTAMDIPTTFEDTADVGIHPGGQGGLHLSLAADPTDSDIVYIGGDRQPLTFNDTFGFPNSIGAADFSGRLFRGDAGLAPGSQWTPLTHSGTASNSSPHADSRDMDFDAGGDLIEGDDGGVYKRLSPRSGTADWVSLNGDIQTTELHSTAYDSNSDIIIGGAQDTGTPQQAIPGNVRWDELQSADGGDVAVETLSTPSQSTRYSSFQNLGAFRRRTYDASNVLQDTMFPGLVVVSGDDFSAQFVNPIATNPVDGDRLILGGSNSVYESLDQGDTLSEIGVGIVTLGFGRNTLAAGATGNADVLYVAGCVGSCFDDMDGLDGIFVRSTAGGALAHSLSASASDLMQGVVNDPAEPGEAFAIDSSTVYRTTNTGGSWTDITNNLSSLDLGTLRSIEILKGSNGDAVVVGGNRGGVMVAYAIEGYGFWRPISNSDLPNAPVYELDYDATNDKLVAGTLGRGAFSLSPADGTADLFTDGFESGDTTAWPVTVGGVR